MAVTNVLAALIGLYFICGGIAMFSDRKAMTGMMQALIEQPVLGYFGGVMAFAIGGTILAVHSLWDGWLTGFITLVGWISLIEGALLIAFRQPFLQLVSKLNFEGHLGTGFGVVTFGIGLSLLTASLV